MPSFALREILSNWDGGLSTENFAENIEKNQSPGLINIDHIGKTIRKAAGYVSFGTEADTGVGFFLYNHRVISDQDEVLVKTINTKLKFHDEVSNAWHSFSTTTFTNNKRWWGASFNGYFYGGNGTDAFVRWQGSAWGKLQNAVTGASTTMDLQSGQGARFPASGSGLIESDDFSWTGKSGDQLTGVTGLSSNHAAGARVVIGAVTYGSNPKGSVGVFYKNRLYVRDDTKPNWIYFSKLATASAPHDDLANFTPAGGSGDAGYFILPSEVLGIRRYITGGSVPILVACCADGILYSLIVTDSGGSTLPTNPELKLIGGDLAAENMMTSTENDLVLIDSFGNIRTVSYADVNSPIKSSRISDIVFPTLQTKDFSDGFTEYFNRKIYFIGKQNDASQNNYTLVKDTNPNAFSQYDHWQLNAITEHKNQLYGISSVNNKVYQLLTGLNADGKIIASYYPTPELDFKAPLILKQLRFIRISGFITSNCNLKFYVFFDENSTPFVFTISGSNTLITSSLDEVSIGSVVFSKGVFGGGLPKGVSKKKFRAQLNMPELQYFNTMYIEVRNQEKDVDFELNKMLLFADVEDQHLIPDDFNLSPD